MADAASERAGAHEALDFESAGRVLRELRSLIEDGVCVPEYGLPALDGYRLERRLGTGASGSVYLARREGSDTRVAVKVFHRRLGSGAESRRVWRELDLLAQTRVACLPRLIDSFEHEGRPCVVTEFIDGLSLERACDGLGVRERVRLLARVCRATHTLHERGIIHRDLKPSNVLVTETDDVFIIDLGIARLLEDDAFATLTHEGSPIGSPAFMSPEQASGASDRVSTRSDVYALGAIGYVLLAGDTPHDMTGTLHASIKAVSEDEAREPSALAPRLDPSLASVLRKAVSRAPERRYASASDLAEDLERWLRGEAVTARPANAWERWARWVGRHPALATGAACASILASSVALTVASVWWMNGRPARVEWSGKRSPARLLTLTGRELRRWPEDAEGLASCNFGGSVRGAGGRRYALVATRFGTGAEHDGLLCAYRFDRFASEPAWIRGVVGRDISVPEGIEGSPPSDVDNPTPPVFVTSDALIEDVFPGPEHPGEEIIAMHYAHPWSASAIRVYSSSGDVISEVWHDGHLRDLCFDRESGVLFCCGVNSERRFIRPKDCSEHAGVLFALRLAPGRCRVLLTDAECPPEYRPLWYKFVTPPGFVCEHRMRSIKRIAGQDGRGAGMIRVEFTPLGSASHDRIFALTLGIDGEPIGSEVDHTLRSAMVYQPEDLVWVDLSDLARGE